MLIDIYIENYVIECHKNFIIIGTENLKANITIANIYLLPYDSKINEEDNFHTMSEFLEDLKHVGIMMQLYVMWRFEPPLCYKFP